MLVNENIYKYHTLNINIIINAFKFLIKCWHYIKNIFFSK